MTPTVAGRAADRAPSGAPPGDEAEGEGSSPRRLLSPMALAYAVGPIALVLLLTMRHFGLVARVSPWAYVAAMVASQASSRLVEAWHDTPPGSLRLHLRVGAHVASVAVIVYMSGWGPALGAAFAFSAFADLQQSGARAWRATLGWSLTGCAIGQLCVLVHWAPSFLGGAQGQTIGFLGAFLFAIEIRMAGAVGEHKERSDALLAEQTAHAAAARDQAQRSEAHYRAVIENAAEGMLTIRSDGTIMSINEAAESIFGWSAAEILGQHATVLVPEANHEPLRALLATYSAPLGTPERTNVESTGVRRDGTYFPMMVSTTPITVDGAEPIVSGIVRDLSEQKRIENQLAHQVLHDSLTGLPNRLMLTDRLDQAIGRARRNALMFGVLFIDLDRFKSVNDTLGHTIGDRLLIEAAARINAAVREIDTVARLGGDEFVVLCEGIEGIHHATDLAQRIIDALQVPFRFGDDEAHVSASIGMALSAEGTVTADAILANADIAMYRAKDNGRARYELFDEAMQQWVANQVALEAALRLAAPRGELRLCYQPIVAGDSGAVHGFEALVRWDRPGVGIVGPDEFIPTAEDTGLIVEIGAWVLDEACRRAASWAQRWPGRHLGIAVNVSGRQLLSDGFLDVVTDTLARTGLDPARLTLELTESTLIDDAVAAQTLLRDLRALGVNLSLDDFGTGYSSLTYLRAFPINILKIDKSFVRTIGTERQDTAIVAAVLALAKNLDLMVVAEGVETHEQLAVLVQLHCPYLQGYLFSPPTGDDAIAALVDAPVLGLANATPPLS